MPVALAPNVAPAIFPLRGKCREVVARLHGVLEATISRILSAAPAGMNAD